MSNALEKAVTKSKISRAEKAALVETKSQTISVHKDARVATKENRQTKIVACICQTEEAGNTLDTVRVNTATRTEACLAEWCSTFSRIHEVSYDLRAIFNACENKRDEAINMLSKTKNCMSVHTARIYQLVLKRSYNVWKGCLLCQ